MVRHVILRCYCHSYLLVSALRFSVMESTMAKSFWILHGCVAIAPPYWFPISLNSLFACAEILLFNIRKPDVSELLSLVSIKTYLHLFIYKQATAGQPSDVWSNLHQVLFPHELRALLLYLIVYHCAWWQHHLLFTAHHSCLWESVCTETLLYALCIQRCL